MMCLPLCLTTMVACVISFLTNFISSATTLLESAMKHPKQVGMSCKNTRFKKRGQTKAEMIITSKKLESNKKRWEQLFLMNKWYLIT